MASSRTVPFAHRRVPVPAASAACAAAAIAAALATGCGGEPAATADAPARDAAPSFREVSRQAGVDYAHAKPVLDAKLDHIMSWMASIGSAAAAADYDGDGWIDLYVTSSRRGTPNRLYRNRGDGTFEEVAAAAGLAAANDRRGASMDAVWGDVDNDGRPDLYLVRWGTDSLYHNQGDGTFTEITERVFRRRDGTPGTDWANGAAAIFLDFDLDGRLDLYVGNYFREVDLWNLEDTRIMHDDFERAQNGGENFLYHQQPDGTFVEVAGKLGVEDPGWTLAVGSADVDNDGDPDLFCADDFGPDRLFLNGGDGTFEDATEGAIGFDTKKGMNVDFGDFNNDGWLDVYVTNITTAEYLQEGNALWHNNGVGADGRLTLTDVSLEAGTYDGGWGWGGKFFDYDNDGDLDLVAVNGFISAGEGNFWYDLATFTVEDRDVADAATWPPIGDRSFSGYEKTRLFRNDGPSFVETAAAEGITSDRDGRGIAVVDYDNDGDLDLFIANQGQPPDLYENLGGGGHWLTVELVADPATGVNADGIGTRVTAVLRGGKRLIRERDGGNGYSAQSDPRLHLGLGDAERVDLLEVRWPDGGLQYLEDVPADRFVTVEQDPAAYAGRAKIAAARAERVERAATPAPAAPPVDPEALDRRLTELEERLSRGRLDHALAATYRKHATAHGAHDRAIDFFTGLVERRPDDMEARIELSLAHVDKIPTCGGVAAIVCKGTLARRSLDQIALVVERQPERWVGWYARGTNHLHWPRALGHADDAAADFARAIEMERALPGGGRAREHREAYVRWGDALTKDGRYEEARRAWRQGLEAFPGDEQLETRLALAGDAEQLAYVEDQRSLERPIETDLSFLERGR